GTCVMRSPRGVTGRRRKEVALLFFRGALLAFLRGILHRAVSQLFLSQLWRTRSERAITLRQPKQVFRVGMKVDQTLRVVNSRTRATGIDRKLNVVPHYGFNGLKVQL